MNPIRLFRAAQAALQSAKRCETDAQLLSHHGSHGHAAGLAILGQEECGKAFTLFLVAAGILAKSEDDVRAALKDHKTKQLFGTAPFAAIEAFLSLVPKEAYIAGVRYFGPVIESGATTAQEPGAATELARRLDEQCAPVRVQLEEAGDRVRTALEAHNREISEENRLQSLKHQGFYVDVDFDSGVTHGPDGVTDTDAVAQIERLSNALSFIEPVITAIDSDEQFAEYRRGVMLGIAHAQRNPSESQPPPQ
jgi:hypothetical protein